MDSEISDDPLELLESLMDFDYIDAEILGSRKPKSAPTNDSRLIQNTGSLLKSKAKITRLEIDSSIVSPVRSPGRPLLTSQRSDNLNFEEDGEDSMDVLGFREGLHSPQKKVSSTVRSARSTLDELLGRGTSSILMERPLTGDKKEFKPDPKNKKMSNKEDPQSDEDFAFGSYQPTMTMNLARRPSRSSSFRFFESDEENLKADNTPLVHCPALGAKSGADWLGLRDEDIPDLPSSVPLKVQESGVTPCSSGHPALETKTENKTRYLPRPSQTTPLQKRNQSTPQARENDIATQPKDIAAEAPAAPQESNEWLISALGRKKMQKQEKTAQNGPKKISEMGTTLPWENTKKGSTSINPTVARQKVESGHTEFLKEPSESITSLSKTLENVSYSQCEVLQLQNRVVDLEAQIRKLQLEKTKQSMLLETLQHGHKEDLELIERAQRNRLKLLEDSAYQREECLRQENQELSSQYLAVVQSAENEKYDLLAGYQRKLTEFLQEKDKEIEKIRKLQRLSVQEMCDDHEKQLQRVKCLKEKEIDAVTSASSKTRSLNGIIEQMEAFYRKLTDLSVRIENSYMNTSQDIELGTQQREGQLRALQERLTQHHKDMEEQRNSLCVIIKNMESQLSEQSRLLEQERWRVSTEQAKIDSLQHSLDEQKRIMTQQMAREREELEKAKNVLLEEQRSVMTHCAEERRKLAAEWAELHTQQKLSKERAEDDLNRAKMAESQREGALLSLAREQAKLKVQAMELRNKEEQLAAAREALEKERQELKHEKDRVYTMAMHVHRRAQEVESMSKMAMQCREEGEKALAEAEKVKSDHQDRLRAIQQRLETLKQQEERLLQEHRNISYVRRQLNHLCHRLPDTQAPLYNKLSNVHQATLISEYPHLDDGKMGLISSEPYRDKAPQKSDIYAKLALLKLSAQQDRDFLEEEQLFIVTLKRSDIACYQNV